ncbi:hypothetical protein L1049_016813 [Liquidambar formosana]|uniref:Protein FAR1-RELATED SEQUENCE n=1 Tax=Liquidambar formosana TaxID=63359 RepID=A0AAP0S026_LIQFO
MAVIDQPESWQGFSKLHYISSNESVLFRQKHNIIPIINIEEHNIVPNTDICNNLVLPRKNPKTNERLWKEFVCYKEGKRDDRYEKKKAMSLNDDGDGRSVQPTQRRGHHKVTKERKCLMKDLREANVPASQQIRIFEIQSGGIENVGCTQRDLLNHERDLRKEMKGHDAENLHEFFKLEKEKNSLFYFEIDCDEEDRMTRCFWADSTARRSYNFFGDVVVFDTTYNTNKYVLADDASLSEEGTTLLKNSMEKVHNEIKELNRSLCVEGGQLMEGQRKRRKILRSEPSMNHNKSNINEDGLGEVRQSDHQIDPGSSIVVTPSNIFWVTSSPLSQQVESCNIQMQPRTRK